MVGLSCGLFDWSTTVSLLTRNKIFNLLSSVLFSIIWCKLVSPLFDYRFTNLILNWKSFFCNPLDGISIFVISYHQWNSFVFVKKKKKKRKNDEAYNVRSLFSFFRGRNVYVQFSSHQELTTADQNAQGRGDEVCNCLPYFEEEKFLVILMGTLTWLRHKVSSISINEFEHSFV